MFCNSGRTFAIKSYEHAKVVETFLAIATATAPLTRDDATLPLSCAMMAVRQRQPSTVGVRMIRQVRICGAGGLRRLHCTYEPDGVPVLVPMLWRSFSRSIRARWRNVPASAGRQKSASFHSALTTIDLLGLGTER